MKGRKLERILYLLLASMLIFWTVFPAVSAFAYITPGTPIVPGKPITPGTPIQGEPLLSQAKCMNLVKL
ncbi:hypothetical protein [Caldifermentibacillus hisashii]|uniref:hypothetical protein n=1 Tax=Caldifermentibacillus hisashii TaxID=996558 RepID=UPI0034D462DF